MSLSEGPPQKYNLDLVNSVKIGELIITTGSRVGKGVQLFLRGYLKKLRRL